MILCELFPDDCKAIEFKKGRVKEVNVIKRGEVLNFVKKKKKLVRGILINPRGFYYRIIDKKYDKVLKNIVDEEFPEIKDRKWQKFEDRKGNIHLAAIESTELEFVKEIIKTTKAQCEVVDVSAFNVANFVIKFYEGIRNGVILNVTEDVTYSIYVKKRVPFWGTSMPTSEFPNIVRKQINYVMSAEPEVTDTFKVYVNFTSSRLVRDMNALKDELKLDIVPIDPTGVAKNLKKVTEEFPSTFTALIGLSLRFQ